jgi:hypothetical protein
MERFHPIGMLHAGRVSRIATVAVAVASCAIAACAGQGAGGDGSVGGGTPPPPPPSDPRAGPPALLASVGQRAVLLDARARVRRVLPAALGPTTRPCPRARRLVDAPDFGGIVEARTLGGRPRWRRRIPVAPTQGIACLDPRARRGAVVLGGNRIKSLHVVSRGSDRIVRRFAGEAPLLTATRLYVTDELGVHVCAVRSRRKLLSLTAPAGIHSVHPSPDGRHWALVSLVGRRDRHFLADTATRAVRPIEIAAMQLVGWLADDRLAVRTRRELVTLDTTWQVRARVSRFRADQALVAGSRILAVDGRALRVLDDSGSSPRPAGTFPRTTWLIAPLR